MEKIDIQMWLVLSAVRAGDMAQAASIAACPLKVEADAAEAVELMPTVIQSSIPSHPLGYLGTGDFREGVDIARANRRTPRKVLEFIEKHDPQPFRDPLVKARILNDLIQWADEARFGHMMWRMLRRDGTEITDLFQRPSTQQLMDRVINDTWYDTDTDWSSCTSVRRAEE